MKRTYMMAIAALMSVMGGSAVANANGQASSAHASSAAAVVLRHTRLGAILTSSSGLTLYEFTRDGSHTDSCVKIKECAKFWPPLETTSRPTAGSGVKASLLSTITLAGGVKQVTYAGHALYTYAADRPGSTGYVGAKAFGGNWYALSASGATVK
jgi:predicted lipoprotein with Yx(FWY)xxD motif